MRKDKYPTFEQQQRKKQMNLTIFVGIYILAIMTFIVVLCYVLGGA